MRLTKLLKLLKQNGQQNKVYQIAIKKRALKALEDIQEPYFTSIKTAIYALAIDPRPFGCKKLRGRNGYRIRVANYRIVYEIFDNVLLIEIINLGHRRDIYQ